MRMATLHRPCLPCHTNHVEQGRRKTYMGHNKGDGGFFWQSPHPKR